MIDKSTLKTMSELEITAVDSALLADITTVHIDTSLDAEARLKLFLSQIKNPYCFNCDATPVRIRYTQSGKPLSKVLSSYFIRRKD